MPLPKFVVLNGVRYAWKDILKARREQKREPPQQPSLFQLKDDARPAPERSAAGRFLEPSLLDLMKGGAQ